MGNIRRSFVWWSLAVFLLLIADRFWPTSYWFSVAETHVDDAEACRPPTMRVDRTIHRDIYMTWTVELEKVLADGSTQFVRRATGENNYRTSSRLPDNLDMDWWTYPQKWCIQPGVYHIETCWTLFPRGFSSRRVCAVSNNFEVR
jgi:hypothetical protein